MAFELSDLIYVGRFLFKTEALGSVLCKGYPRDAEKEVGSWFNEHKEPNSEQFARFLLTKLCVLSNDSKDDSDVFLTAEQVALVTKDELERFCEKFIHMNHYLLTEVDVDQYKSPEDEKGRYSIDYKRLFADEYKRVGVENCCSYLLYVLKDYHENYYQRLMDKFEKLSGVYSSATSDLFEENMRLSHEVLQTTYDVDPLRIEIPEHHLPPPPLVLPNPIDETNRSIKALANEMRAVNRLVENMNKLGLQMNIDSTISARKIQWWNIGMFSLGLITLVVTAIFSYQGLSSANQSSAALERLMEQQNVLLSSQVEKQERLLKLLAVLPENGKQEVRAQKAERKDTVTKFDLN